MEYGVSKPIKRSNAKHRAYQKCGGAKVMNPKDGVIGHVSGFI